MIEKNDEDTKVGGSASRSKGSLISRAVTTAFALMMVAGLPPSASGAALVAGGPPSEIKYKVSMQWWVDRLGKPIEVVNGITNQRPAGAVAKATVETEGSIADPPFASLLSGRVTYGFLPGDVVVHAGWYGEFGEDPLGLAPPVATTLDALSVSAVQNSANAAMASSGLSVDYVTGRVVVEFDWGPAGFTPTRNLSADGHFNFAGVFLTRSDGLSSDLTMLGSLSDIQANGTGAASYLMCGGPIGAGFCGQDDFRSTTAVVTGGIPEPSTWWLMTAGFGMLGIMLARRSKRKRRFLSAWKGPQAA